jgi:hypothetical protein
MRTRRAFSMAYHDATSPRRAGSEPQFRGRYGLPTLTRSFDIQLNKRVSLPQRAEAVNMSASDIAPIRTQHGKATADYAPRGVTAQFSRRPRRLDRSYMIVNLIRIWTLARCFAGEWILCTVVHIFPRGTLQRRACKRAYRTYVEMVGLTERELGGFDP